jgi:hypothetical protein
MNAQVVSELRMSSMMSAMTATIAHRVHKEPNQPIHAGTSQNTLKLGKKETLPLTASSSIS